MSLNAPAHPPWYGGPPSLTLGSRRHVFFLEQRDHLASQTQGPSVPPHQGSEPPNFSGTTSSPVGTQPHEFMCMAPGAAWTPGADSRVAATQAARPTNAEYTYCQALCRTSLLSLRHVLSISSLPATGLPSSMEDWHPPQCKAGPAYHLPTSRTWCEMRGVRGGGGRFLPSSP